MSESNVVYKIRNKDGLYSTGGSSPSFTKNGKVWNSKSALNNHIRMLIDYASSWNEKSKSIDVYKDCELITIFISKVEVETCSLEDLINDIRNIRDKK